MDSQGTLDSNNFGSSYDTSESTECEVETCFTLGAIPHSSAGGVTFYIDDVTESFGTSIESFLRNLEAAQFGSVEGSDDSDLNTFENQKMTNAEYSMWKAFRPPGRALRDGESVTCAICLDEIRSADYFPTAKKVFCMSFVPKAIQKWLGVDPFYYKEPNVTELDCQHIYHDSCIHAWFTSHSTKCPLCNHQISFGITRPRYRPITPSNITDSASVLFPVDSPF